MVIFYQTVQLMDITMLNIIFSSGYSQHDVKPNWGNSTVLLLRIFYLKGSEEGQLYAPKKLCRLPFRKK